MSQPRVQVGQQLGSWILERRIHRGNQAEIWQARGGTETVAIKVSLSESWSEVLDREANLLCEAQVSGVVRFIEAEAGGRWLAMEWVNGTHSADWAAHHEITEIARILEQVSSTLSKLHSCGLVHGDLAPANLLVDSQGQAQLLDFGLGVGSESIPARTGLHGTPGYVAPENLDGGTPDFRSDLYSLGALAYRLLTGRHPYSGVEPQALHWQPRLSIPRPPSSIRTAIPLEMDALILRLLSRDPDHRPQALRVRELWAELATRSPARPIVGNHPNRTALRQALAKALDGESVQVLLHGSLGSGRRTLIREVCRIAILEGLHPVVLDFDEVDDLSALRESLKTSMATQGSLCLVRARQAFDSLEDLGLSHLRLAALEPEDVAHIMEHCGQGSSQAESICSQTQGHPAAVWAHLGFPQTVPAAVDRGHLLLNALKAGPRSVQMLSSLLGISEHGLLDMAEPLLNRGAIIELENGELLGLPLGA